MQAIEEESSEEEKPEENQKEKAKSPKTIKKRETTAIRLGRPQRTKSKIYHSLRVSVMQF